MNLTELAQLLLNHDDRQIKARNAMAGRPFYGGTVPHKVKARRRAANKASRSSRRANRAR